MWVSVRRKHWLVASVTLTCLLVLLALTTSPPRSPTFEENPPYLRRHISNEETTQRERNLDHTLPHQQHFVQRLEHEQGSAPERQPFGEQQPILLGDGGTSLTQEHNLEKDENRPLMTQVEEERQQEQRLEQLEQQQEAGGQETEHHHQENQQLVPQQQVPQKQKDQQQNLQKPEAVKDEPSLQGQQQPEPQQPPKPSEDPPVLQLTRTQTQSESSSTSRSAEVVSKPRKEVHRTSPSNSQLSQPHLSAMRQHSGPRGLSISDTLPSIRNYADLYSMGEMMLSNRMRMEFRHGGQSDINFEIGKPVPPNSVRRVHLLSTWRSGSTFLGDLVKAYPGTFYSFEPLHHLLKNLHLQEGPLVKNVTSLLRDIMMCNLEPHEEYVTYMRNFTFLLEHNTRVWSVCLRNRALCFDKTFISRMCSLMPVNVIKTVRMGLKPILSLLEDPELNLYVVQLVRDPRGSLHSRMKLKWCKSKACSDPATVCSDLLYDLRLSKIVSQQFPNRYRMLRYEDLSTEPERVTRNLFEFLNLSYDYEVEKFVKTHTTVKKNSVKKGLRGNAYTTYRDSKTTATAWRGALNYSSVVEIQRACMEPLKLLNYRIFQTPEEYRDDSLSVLL